MLKVLILLALISLPRGQLHCQTIAEKKAGIFSGSDDLSPELKELLQQTNNEIINLQEELSQLYAKIQILYEEGAPANRYAPLLAIVKSLKSKILVLQENWHQKAVAGSKEADYALWNQPDTTIGQLVNDFGSYNYLYVTSPEISTMKISLDSNLPIPRSSWDEVLEFVLNQSGVGFRQLNPYVRELYIINDDVSNPRLITSNRGDLDLFPGRERVVFVIRPDASEAKRIWYFLDKFINPNTTALQMIGRDLLIIGNVAEIKELLKVFDFVSTSRGDREYKAIKVHKVPAEEMASVLAALFESIEGEVESEDTFVQPNQDGDQPQRSERRRQGGPQVRGASTLRIVALKDIAQAIFLVGTKEEIRKAEEIVKEVEDQIGETRKKEIVWYHVKHSDPEELAQILYRIYELMIETGTGSEQEQFLMSEEGIQQRREQIQEGIIDAVEAIPKIPLGVINDTGFLSSANYLNNPEDRRVPRQPPNQGRNNFLVDLKTGSLIMVIEADLIAEMKNLLKRLDVPKRMVQIEVMLVEQVIANQNDIGLNLLKLGSAASQVNSTDLLFNVLPGFSGTVPGITDFIVRRAPTCGGMPAFDIAYHFLISRDDVRISASPSVLAMNETEARIEFEEEISVSVGTFVVPNAGTATLQESFARARYGIQIDVIPTIHLHDPNDPTGDSTDYITLDSDVKFETVAPDNINNRPRVIRRTLKNIARIADGKTVIIGGFRRKDTQDSATSVPFLGDIPGIGKLFSNTFLRDTSVETFLFLTAKIASEPLCDLEAIKMEEMAKRPGDLPYFMKALRDSRDAEQYRYLHQTMRLLFGKEPDRFVDREACEYDGRN
jgi:general secretion pathway protein D